MTETATKRGPKKAKATPKAKPLGYNKQAQANQLLKDFFLATSNKDGLAATAILDHLTELLESALE